MVSRSKVSNYSETELARARAICALLEGGEIEQGIEKLRLRKDEIYASIPEKLRIGRGITWVVQQISDQLSAVVEDDEQIRTMAVQLYEHLPPDDRLLGVALFLMADYGSRHFEHAFSFFERAADSPDWVVREFTQGAFHGVIAAQREAVLPWLQQMAESSSPNLRRFAAESLRPVTFNRWINQQPEYSLSVLRRMFREPHPYPRTSVGNNLSDLSRRQPELIFGIIAELVASGDPNSYWIAYRACRNLVKKDPMRVMDLLGVEEYHYKDRNFYR